MSLCHGHHCIAQCPPLQFGRSLQYGTRTMLAKFVHIERYRLSSTQKLIKSTHWWNSLPPEATYVQETFFLYLFLFNHIYSYCMFFVVCILVVVCSSSNCTLLDFCGYNILLFVMCFVLWQGRTVSADCRRLNYKSINQIKYSRACLPAENT